MNRHYLGFALAVAFHVLLIGSAAAGSADKRLDIYWIDVEGGAATLIVTPAGESVLVDTGNPGERDAGRIFRTAKNIAGLNRIDYLVITHYHSDHFGGAAPLAAMMPIKTVYDNGNFEGMPNKPSEAYYRFKADKRVVLNPGDDIPLRALGADGPSLNLTCLVARRKFISPPGGDGKTGQVCTKHKPKPINKDDNGNSIVLRLDFGPFRFFDAGDLTWNVEHRLVCPVNLAGRADAYQVTHHGLDSSNHPAVPAALQPTVAVMNNGVTKGCQPETFATLKATRSIEAIYQMHKNLRRDGSVNNTDDAYIANLKEDCDGHYIKLSVDPEGKTYTISIPASGHKRTYQTK